MGLLSWLFGDATDTPENAIKIQENKLKINPNDWEAYAILGAIYERLDNLEMMMICAKEVIRINPKRIEGHRGLGWAYFNSELYIEAKESFQSALEINANDMNSNSGLGLIFLELKDKENALKQVNKLRSIGSPRWSQLLERINDKL